MIYMKFHVCFFSLKNHKTNFRMSSVINLLIVVKGWNTFAYFNTVLYKIWWISDYIRYVESVVSFKYVFVIKVSQILSIKLEKKCDPDFFHDFSHLYTLLPSFCCNFFSKQKWHRDYFPMALLALLLLLLASTMLSPCIQLDFSNTRVSWLMTLHTLICHDVRCGWLLQNLTCFSFLAGQCLVCAFSSVSWTPPAVMT